MTRGEGGHRSIGRVKCWCEDKNVMHLQGIRFSKLQCGTRNDRNIMYDCMIDFIILLHIAAMGTV